MEPGTTGLRWMWIWITLCALVVVVVIGFLFGITGSLDSIDDGLAEANTAVSGAGGDVEPLPTHIQRINGSLVRIDEALKPIPNQADQIINATQSIEGSLTTVNNSLRDTEYGDDGLRATSGLLTDTSRSLVNTAASLAGTSGTLVTVEAGLVRILALANRIEGTLIRAQDRGSLGTNAIWRRVRFLNGGKFIGGGQVNPRGLGCDPEVNPRRATDPCGIERDAAQILGGLREVNKHLDSICEQIPSPLSTAPTSTGTAPAVARC